jgi:hypothetical protein
MEIVGVIERIEHIGAVRANPVADTKMIASGLVANREARAWRGNGVTPGPGHGLMPKACGT